MEERKSTSNGQSSVPSTGAAPPPWMQHATQLAPGRRARMLEHMARARSRPQTQAVTSMREPSSKSVLEHVVDFTFRMILFGIIGFAFESRFPLYLGMFYFFTNGEFVEWTLGRIGIRFEPDAIGPDLVKCFVSWFGWGTLLASWKSSAPAWLMSWMPPNTSWTFIAITSLMLAVVDAVAAVIVRRVLPRFGLRIRSDSLLWTPVQIAVFLALLSPAILYDTSTSAITHWLAAL